MFSTRGSERGEWIVVCWDGGVYVCSRLVRRLVDGFQRLRLGPSNLLPTKNNRHLLIYWFVRQNHPQALVASQPISARSQHPAKAVVWAKWVLSPGGRVTMSLSISTWFLNSVGGKRRHNAARTQKAYPPWASADNGDPAIPPSKV